MSWQTQSADCSKTTSIINAPVLRGYFVYDRHPGPVGECHRNTSSRVPQASVAAIRHPESHRRVSPQYVIQSPAGTMDPVNVLIRSNWILVVSLLRMTAKCDWMHRLRLCMTKQNRHWMFCLCMTRNPPYPRRLTPET